MEGIVTALPLRSLTLMLVRAVFMKSNAESITLLNRKQTLCHCVTVLEYWLQLMSVNWYGAKPVLVVYAVLPEVITHQQILKSSPNEY